MEAVIPPTLHERSNEALRPTIPCVHLTEPESGVVQPDQLVHDARRQGSDGVPGHEGLEDEQTVRCLHNELLGYRPTRFGPKTFRERNAFAAKRLRLGIRLPFEDHPLPVSGPSYLVGTGLAAAQPTDQLVGVSRFFL